MLTLVIWTSVALGAAALVLLVAAAAEGRTGDLRGYFRDLAAGLRELRSGTGSRTDADRDARPTPSGQPVDASLDELLAAATVDEAPYLAVEDLTETLARARDRASRGVSGLTRR